MDQGPDGAQDLCLVVASHEEACLQRNLMASPMVRAGMPVHVERGAPSAAAAYNRGLDATTAPIVIFAHQDVYFPPGWDRLLRRTLAQLDAADPSWALVGSYGISTAGDHVGDIWGTGLSRRLGAPFPAPVPAQSFDEHVIVMRRAAGLRFDPALPGFHLYGTDIVQTARAAGRGAYVAWLPLVHNHKFYPNLGADFAESYHFTRRKWRGRLPLRTPVLWIRWHGLSLRRYQFMAWLVRGRRRAMAGDTTTDPRHFSALCGWESAGWHEAAPLPPA